MSGWRPFVRWHRSFWSVWIGISRLDRRGQPYHGVSMSLTFKPPKWQFRVFHTYYDGTNCQWAFGPIEFDRFGGWNCRKCLDGEER